MILSSECVHVKNEKEKNGQIIGIRMNLSSKIQRNSTNCDNKRLRKISGRADHARPHYKINNPAGLRLLLAGNDPSQDIIQVHAIMAACGLNLR